MISVIIPVYNEAPYLETLLPYLLLNGGELVSEIIVADGGSNDNTHEICLANNITKINCEAKQRSAQMNAGAVLATGDILYFVHADTLPPPDFATSINAIFNKSITIARYRTCFQSKSVLLKMNAFFTRFDIFMCYGGDNTLAISKKLFAEIKGFDETLAIMEDYDITERARKTGRYAVLSGCVKVSARKYEKNSWLAVQRANYKAVKMYRQGIETPIIAQVYRQSLKF